MHEDLTLNFLAQTSSIEVDKFSIILSTFAPQHDFSKRVKAKVANFYGRLNPKAFIDWLNSLEDYFYWLAQLTLEAKLPVLCLGTIGVPMS